MGIEISGVTFTIDADEAVDMLSGMSYGDGFEDYLHEHGEPDSIENIEAGWDRSGITISGEVTLSARMRLDDVVHHIKESVDWSDVEEPGLCSMGNPNVSLEDGIITASYNTVPHDVHDSKLGALQRQMIELRESRDVLQSQVNGNAITIEGQNVEINKLTQTIYELRKVVFQQGQKNWNLQERMRQHGVPMDANDAMIELPPNPDDEQG